MANCVVACDEVVTNLATNIAAAPAAEKAAIAAALGIIGGTATPVATETVMGITMLAAAADYNAPLSATDVTTPAGIDAALAAGSTSPLATTVDARIAAYAAAHPGAATAPVATETVSGTAMTASAADYNAPLSATDYATPSGVNTALAAGSTSPLATTVDARIAAYNAAHPSGATVPVGTDTVTGTIMTATLADYNTPLSNDAVTPSNLHTALLEPIVAPSTSANLIQEAVGIAAINYINGNPGSLTGSSTPVATETVTGTVMLASAADYNTPLSSDAVTPSSLHTALLEPIVAPSTSANLIQEAVGVAAINYAIAQGLYHHNDVYEFADGAASVVGSRSTAPTGPDLVVGRQGRGFNSLTIRTQSAAITPTINAAGFASIEAGTYTVTATITSKGVGSMAFFVGDGTTGARYSSAWHFTGVAEQQTYSFTDTIVLSAAQASNVGILQHAATASVGGKGETLFGGLPATLTELVFTRVDNYVV